MGSGFQSYDSNLSSRSSSRSGVNAAVFDDDYEEDSSYDDYPNERNFTKSVENIDDESSEAWTLYLHWTNPIYRKCFVSLNKATQSELFWNVVGK